MTLRYLTTASPRQRLAFDRAVARWRQVIVGDLANVVVNAPAYMCGLGEPALAETVDDVLIYVELGPIDGAGGTLGAAGPCAVRTTGSRTVIGLMRFDTSDLLDLESDGQLDDAILHEMGHVFGIGSLWPTFSLLAGAGSADPYYTGPSGRPGFSLIGGDVYAGNDVPVENTGGTGTRDGHWRESVLRSELMTGYIQPPGVRNAISHLTIGAMEDLGYGITTWGYDRFQFGLDFQSAPAVATAGAPTARELREVPLPKPPVALDESGRPVAARPSASLVGQPRRQMLEAEAQPTQVMEVRRP